ncbi:MAG: dihydrodipicolinate synthase family protein [Rhodobiaceae bacterium]|nr:dihydrodipicolinate synthase family protein [Rhodobiaceae bacterium]
MDRNSVDWTGAMPALTTPFNENGKIDFDAHAANIERQMAAGATGFVAAGCTGEFWALSHQERAELAAATVDAVAGRGTTIIGTGAILPHEVVAQSEAAAKAGADAILVVPPYFVRSTDEEIIAHYAAVNRDTALPIVLYNIPGNAGNNLSPELVLRLADLDKVVAVKESSGNWLQFRRTLMAVKDRIRVYCGPSSVFGVEAVRAGADGLIDCFPNVWTGCLDIWSATRNGEDERAQKLQATGLALTDLFTSDGRTLYPATKAAMSYLGYAGGGPLRLPLLSLKGPALDGLYDGLVSILGSDIQNVAVGEAAS